jgi:hypothetical protein
MIVYVETNFLLELSFLQEEYGSCNEVLALAEAGTITLVIPAFSITEASIGRVRLAKQRIDFRERLTRELRELSRSKPYAEISVQTEPLTKALIESTEEQKNSSKVQRRASLLSVRSFRCTGVRSNSRWSTNRPMV